MNKIKIQYSIVSKGTERHTKKGYMAISRACDKKRNIYDLDHAVLEADATSEKYLTFDDLYDIRNIAFSRFELMSELMLRRVDITKEDQILIIGMGSVGLAALINLLDKDIKKIDICVTNITAQKTELINQLNLHYKSKINLLTSFSNEYTIYIDASGDGAISKEIVSNANFFSILLIIGTPRPNDTSFNIDILDIHRKNLLIMGGHEVNGVDFELKNQLYNQLLHKNAHGKKSILATVVRIKKINSLGIEDENNFIEVYDYDL